MCVARFKHVFDLDCSQAIVRILSSSRVIYRDAWTGASWARERAMWPFRVDFVAIDIIAKSPPGKPGHYEAASIATTGLRVYCTLAFWAIEMFVRRGPGEVLGQVLERSYKSRDSPANQTRDANY